MIYSSPKYNIRKVRGLELFDWEVPMANWLLDEILIDQYQYNVKLYGWVLQEMTHKIGILLDTPGIITYDQD